MKPRLFVLLLCASLLAAVQARAKTVLPDSCGDDNTRFDVKLLKTHTSLPPPDAGKAQIIFIETVDTNGAFFTTPSTRFGVDGKWVGANRGSSYFVVSVDPGVHHLCANWQSDTDDEARQVGMEKFTAEAGKIYYFQVMMKRKRSIISGGPNGGGGMITDKSFVFSQLDDDEGSYRVKAAMPSTWKTHIAEP
ncbi:MAG: hypothetical protein ACLQGT_00150 [Terracidiphilus sp.]